MSQAFHRTGDQQRPRRLRGAGARSPRCSTSAARSPAFSTSTSCCAQIPRLIGRLISFDAFAVYLLDERRGELRIGVLGRLSGRGRADPAEARATGLVGAAVASEQPLLVNDVHADPRYIEFVPGMDSELVVPLLHKSRPIGALNILSRNRDQFTARDVDDRCASSPRTWRSRSSTRGCSSAAGSDAEAFETLAEIGREVGVGARSRRAVRAHRAADQAA